MNTLPPSLDFAGVSREEFFIIFGGIVVLLIVVSRISDYLTRRRIERMQREDTGIDWSSGRRD